MLPASELSTRLHRLITAIVVLGLILVTLVTRDPASARGSTAPERLAAPDPALIACPGTPVADLSVEGCGLLLDGTRLLFWDRVSTGVEDALAPSRLVLVGLPRNAEAAPQAAITVWHRAATGEWRGWGAGVTAGTSRLDRFETGETYVLVASTPVAWSLPPLAQASLAAPPAAVPASIFATGQVVAYYGFPGVAQMGILGEYATAEAMRLVVEQAAVFDALNGTQTVTPALELITAVAQADPGYDGTYLGRLSLDTVFAYAEVAAAVGGVLILDIQIGWSDPLTEVRGYEAALRLPNVHVALDPEFATWRKGDPPGEAIGSVTGDEVIAVQRYLADLVRTHGLPPKTLVVHQFRDDMILEPERIAVFAGVDLVIDIDGWGGRDAKLSGYERYALAPYAPLAGLKLFYRWDEPVMAPATLLGLERPPKLIIYQ